MSALIDYVEQINKASNDINTLEEIRKTMDPASGISVRIRRGVLSDQVENEADREPRKWVDMEICQNMEKIIDLLIEARRNSLKMWCEYGLVYAADITKAEAKARAKMVP